MAETNPALTIFSCRSSETLTQHGLSEKAKGLFVLHYLDNNALHCTVPGTEMFSEVKQHWGQFGAGWQRFWRWAPTSAAEGKGNLGAGQMFSSQPAQRGFPQHLGCCFPAQMRCDVDKQTQRHSPHSSQERLRNKVSVTSTEKTVIFLVPLRWDGLLQLKVRAHSIRVTTDMAKIMGQYSSALFSNFKVLTIKIIKY